MNDLIQQAQGRIEAAKHLVFNVVSYDEQFDTFTLSQVDDNVEDTEIDLDDFTVPAPVLAALVGEWGEPDEMLEKMVMIKLP